MATENKQGPTSGTKSSYAGVPDAPEQLQRDLSGAPRVAGATGDAGASKTGGAVRPTPDPKTSAKQAEVKDDLAGQAQRTAETAKNKATEVTAKAKETVGETSPAARRGAGAAVATAGAAAIAVVVRRRLNARRQTRWQRTLTSARRAGQVSGRAGGRTAALAKGAAVAGASRARQVADADQVKPVARKGAPVLGVAGSAAALLLVARKVKQRRGNRSDVRY